MRRHAFTLIETMLVVAIAGIMTSLAVAGLHQTLAVTAETRAARSVAQLIKRARTTAVARHQRVTIRPNVAAHRVELAGCAQRFGDNSCVAGSSFVADTAGVSFALDFSGVKVDAPATDIVFNADGFPAASSVWRFDHVATAGAQEVILTVGGDVRLQSTTTTVSTHEL